MARFNAILLIIIITMLVLVNHNSSLLVDARKVIKIEAQEKVPFVKGTSSVSYYGRRHVARFAGGSERVLVQSTPSPGAGHR
ncbi:uncharacterized protein DS421_18g618100 [Arachis hypogaea]|nr:uncharacterized protein DS421_18g618100 [Arachis hypogaea]